MKCRVILLRWRLVVALDMLAMVASTEAAAISWQPVAIRSSKQHDTSESRLAILRDLVRQFFGVIEAYFTMGTHVQY
jgi:hypothetical protein